MDLFGGFYKMGKMNLISASEIVDIMGAKPHDEESRNLALIVRRKAMEIKSAVRVGQVPHKLEQIGVNFFSAEDQRNTFIREMVPGVQVRGQADLQTENAVIKVVPEGLSSGLILKMALIQSARNDGTGAIYQANKDQLVEIGSVSDLEPEIAEIVVDALEIRDIRLKLKNNRRSIAGAARDAINKKEIGLHHELDLLTGEVLQEIKMHRLHYLE